MKGFCSLASGSKGNSLYIGTGRTKILIDAGLSAKALTLKLSEINVRLEEIQAILITHEHTDHIAGLKTLAFKHEIPLIANSDTAKEILTFCQDTPKFKIFTTGDSFQFQDLDILPFSVEHDAIDPVGFCLTFEGIKMGIATDLGFASTCVKQHLKGCHYLFIEANHSPPMVHASSRPKTYKERVLSRSGHLSNESCGELLQELFHPELREVQLAHLSQECNTPEMALKTVRHYLGEQTPLSTAPQYTIGRPIQW